MMCVKEIIKIMKDNTFKNNIKFEILTKING